MLTLYDYPPRVAFWLPVICAPVIAFTFASMATRDDVRLEREGVVTTALVREKHPRDQQTVSVSYTVAGRGYQNYVHPSGRYERVQVGDSIEVTYLPSDPAVVRGGRPSGTRYWPWAAGLFGLLGGLGVGSSNVRRIHARRELDARSMADGIG